MQAQAQRVSPQDLGTRGGPSARAGIEVVVADRAFVREHVAQASASIDRKLHIVSCCAYCNTGTA